jgi:hypothetical protein
MFLCFIIPSPDHPGPCINVMLKRLIEELNQLWEGVEVYDYDQKQTLQEIRKNNRSKSMNLYDKPINLA